MRIERTKNAGRNMVFGTLMRIYQIVMPFVIRTFMIRYMGAAYTGLSGLFTSILHVLNLAELGVGSAMVYSMYQAIAEDNHDEICALMRLYRRYYRIIGIVVLVVGLAIMPLLPVLVNKDVPADISINTLYLMNLAYTVASYWLFAYRSSLVQAYQRNDIISKVTICANTIMYALQLAAIILFDNYYVYTSALILGQILINVLTAIASSRMYPQYRPEGELSAEKVAAINHRIRDLFTSKIGAVVLDSCDSLVITAFLGLEMLAIHQNYYYVITALAMFFTVFFTSLVAGVGNSIATETTEHNYGLFREITFITIYALGFCCTCMFCLYQPFIKLWVGEKLMLGNDLVILYCVFFFIYEFCRMLNLFKDAAGIWHADRFRPLVVSMANLGINILLVKHIGLAGVLISTIVSYYFLNFPWLVRNVFTYVFDRKSGAYLGQAALLVAVGVVSCVVSYYCCGFIQMGGFVGLVVRFGICVVCNTVVQLPVYLRFEEFRRTCQRAMNILRRHKMVS